MNEKRRDEFEVLIFSFSNVSSKCYTVGFGEYIHYVSSEVTRNHRDYSPRCTYASFTHSLFSGTPTPPLRWSFQSWMSDYFRRLPEHITRCHFDGIDTRSPLDCSVQRRVTRDDLRQSLCPYEISVR